MLRECRYGVYAVAFACAAFAAVSSAAETTSTAARRFGTWGVDLAGMDTTVRPGDDFFRYVNGTWLDTAVIASDARVRAPSRISGS